jgi:exodeoxyribonuclease VII large subunit
VNDPAVYTVTTLTAGLQRLIAGQYSDIRVTGEISGYKLWSSGHAYFTLKDAGAQLRCVLFRNTARWLKCRPADGLAVTLRGSVEVRAERGEYQLIVTHLEPRGAGELQQAFEQLKKKLAEEGLFSAERKRPLPAYPRHIGIVTSPSGAVIRDMLNVLGRRFPGLHIRLWPTPVQGAGSIEGVCAGLRHFSESGWADLVIVGRGGGSLEDLWTFNEESVARAIVGCSVPVISAVGHETDFTIADFVADLRAPTPSAAAELAVRDRADLSERIEATRRRAARATHFHIARAARRLHERGIQRAQLLLTRRIGRAGQRLDELEERLRQRDPRARLAQISARLARASERLRQTMARRLSVATLRVSPLDARLRALSPLAVLERGYSILSTAGGHVVRDPADTASGEVLDARLARGRMQVVVEPPS